MTGKQCGNTNWYNEYETIVAIFRRAKRLSRRMDFSDGGQGQRALWVVLAI